jgi:hypothetical protein
MLPAGPSSTTPILRRIFDPLQGDRGERALLLVEGHDVSNVDVGQGVTHDDDEGVVEVRLQTLHAAGRAPELLLPAEVYVHASYRRGLSVSRQQSVRQVADVDVDLLSTRLRQQLEDVLDDGRAGDRGQGFGDLAGQRVESGALPGGQDHRLHRFGLLLKRLRELSSHDP